MKATVVASSLSKAMKVCMKENHSPRLVFNDNGVCIGAGEHGLKPIEVEGKVHEDGWGHVEYPRAQKIVQALDALGDREVTLSYEGNWVRFIDLRL